jgi:hypothetical protein
MPDTQCGFHNIPGGATGAEMLTTYGPTLSVDIGFDPNFTPAQGLIAPRPGISGVLALVDTGATESCIDSTLATQLGLPIVDRRTFGGISGSAEVNMHLAQIRVPSLNFIIYGAFAGVHLAAGGQNHLALIGRTFLQNCIMNYDGPTGAVRISIPNPPAHAPIPPASQPASP